jgi:FlgD Ig-like domain
LQRILSTAVLVGLLAATAAAFAITERLKLTKSPISGTVILRDHLSPTAHTTAAFALRLRRRDRVTVTIDDSHGSEVDTLAAGVVMPRGRRTFTWNGMTDAGTKASDGTYRMEVHFANQHRTILIPNPIVLDTRPPAVLDAGSARPVFSPDGDHQADHVTIHYRLSEPAHVVVSLDGRRIIRGRFSKEKDKVSWDGRVGGRLLPPGRHVLTIGAVDLAGNKATEVQRVAVVIRYIALGAKRIVVRGGARVRVRVGTDAKRYSWKLGARSGKASARELTVRAPDAAGTYRLTVTERGHSAAASVVVG